MNNFILTAVIVIFFTTYLSAQIINGGFENWTNGDPDNWTSIDIPNLIDAISQSPDAHSGSSAAKFEVVNFNGNPYTPLLNSGVNSQGFPVSERYANLTGWYKFAPLNNDKINIVVVLYKETVALGGGLLEIFSAAPVYTQFNIPILYSLAGTPDTVRMSIFLTDSVAGAPLNIGTIALFDDLSLGGITGVEQFGEVPSEYILYQNYPNPFNPSTKIDFSIPSESFIELKIFNVLGKEVEILTESSYPAGKHSFNFAGENLPSGIYIARLNITSKHGFISKAIKMSLVK